MQLSRRFAVSRGVNCEWFASCAFLWRGFAFYASGSARDQVHPRAAAVVLARYAEAREARRRVPPEPWLAGALPRVLLALRSPLPFRYAAGLAGALQASRLVRACRPFVECVRKPRSTAEGKGVPCLSVSPKCRSLLSIKVRSLPPPPSRFESPARCPAWFETDARLPGGGRVTISAV